MEEHHISPLPGCLKTAHTAEESGSRGSLGAKRNQPPRGPETADEAARVADTSSSSPVLARQHGQRGACRAGGHSALIKAINQRANSSGSAMNLGIEA